MQLEPHPQSSMRRPPGTWTRRFWRLIFVIFCFEIGLFLLVFPWLEYWDTNRISLLTPWLHDIWDNSYFRGAVSGLGVMNLLISFGELFRPRKQRVDKMKVSSI